jgi:peptidoglycan/LPS O-acetylase OafA/YrhL
MALRFNTEFKQGSFMRNSRFNLFDFMRLIAATLVIYSHSFPLLGLTPPDLITKFFPFINSGGLGVLIFFSISGYLNAKSAIKHDTSLFYLNRALRIFPGLLVAILFSVFIIGTICSDLTAAQYFSSAQTWQYVFHIPLVTHGHYLPGVFEHNLYQNAVNGSLWTLPTEFALYLMLPPTLKMFRNKSIACFIAAVLMLCVYLLSMIPSVSAHAGNTFGLGPLTAVSGNAFVFSVGALIAMTEPNLSKTVFVFLIGLLAAAAKFGFGSVLFLLVIPFVIIKIGLLETKIFALKNDISYGVYIYGFPVQQAVWHFLKQSMPAVVMMLISFLITAILAALSWRLIEKPILMNRNYFALKLLGSGHPDTPDQRVM